MKVRLKVSRAGYRDGDMFTENAGDEVEVSSEEAKRLLESGQAEVIAKKKVARSETRTTKKPAEKR